MIGGVISRLTIHIRRLITLLITTHEPPSRGSSKKGSIRIPLGPFMGFSHGSISGLILNSVKF